MAVRWGMRDLVSGVLLLALALYYLAVSWRKWADPLVDFGRELYTPWRLAGGAVMYRDVDGFYGPLSQYFNGIVFAIFGPSLTTLVAVNLIVFTAIVALLYFCCRRAWGALAAFVASALFISVFGFSQHVLAGNFNYATPYAHETTHGVLVCLALVAVLARWLERPTVRTSAFVGGLVGLTAILKPEIMLAAGLLLLTGLVLHGWRHGWPRAAHWGALAVGLVVPSVGFFAYFLLSFPAGEALAVTAKAWLNVASSSHTGGVIQANFLGTDQIGANLGRHLAATLLALAVGAGLAGAAWAADRVAAARVRYALCAAWVGVVAWLASRFISWPEVGRCLLGVMLLFGAVKSVAAFRARAGSAAWPHETMRLLLAVLAAGLLARMALNGRLFQYGFYQAALAAVLIPAVVVGELRGWLRLKQGNLFVIAGTVALLLPGVVHLTQHSNTMFRLKTELIGSGGDRFYAFPEKIAPGGRLVNLGLDYLSRQPAGASLVVLPEGTMINYLTRRPSTVPEFSFYAATTTGGREAKLVERLRANPPDWVMLVTFDLREYGIARYGEKSGSGLDLLRWLETDYQRTAKVGGDPLDPLDAGAQIFQPKAPAR